MYKIIADTSTKDLFIALIKDNKCIDYILKMDLLKKTDVLPDLFSNLIKKNNIKLANVKEFYTTNGPGSFTGSRCSYIFFKTICMINNTNLYILDSLTFLSQSSKEEEIIIDARSKMQYIAYFKNKNMIGDIKLQISNKIPSVFNIKDFLLNTKLYLSKFKKQSDLLITNINYIKKPSIGEIKK